MSRTLAMICLFSAFGLGSCVSAPEAPGFAWSYQNDAGEGPKLAYGAPASDNVVLMMTCAPGSEQVNVSLMGGSPHGGLTLVSGDARQQLRGDVVASSGMGQTLEVSTHSRSGPLARFAGTGNLSLVDRGHTVILNAAPSERARVASFFEACSA